MKPVGKEHPAARQMLRPTERATLQPLLEARVKATPSLILLTLSRTISPRQTAEKRTGLLVMKTTRSARATAKEEMIRLKILKSKMLQSRNRRIMVIIGNW